MSSNSSLTQILPSPLIAGIERKVLGEGGSILGDLLLVDDIRVVAHPFKEDKNKIQRGNT